MRIKASASGVHAEEYRAELARDRGYTGSYDTVRNAVRPLRAEATVDGEVVAAAQVTKSVVALR